MTIPTDTEGNGTRPFNIYVEPGTGTSWGVRDLLVCLTTSGTATASVWVTVTGQRVVTTATANRVLDFQARGGSAGTTLRWTTGSEAQIAGFNVWRYRNGKRVKVNRSLIRAKRSGSSAGASYRFVDRSAGARRGLTYRLQIVDHTGKRTWYAAFAVA